MNDISESSLRSASENDHIQASFRTADATPHASALVESLRDIGYSLDTALADIIDNSITAGANHIKLLVDTLSDEPRVGILDDGSGMTEADLIEAMRPGSKNPRLAREQNDLGRFGLGLKSASFSQCRKMTVFTRKNGSLAGATWDLDQVAATNQWQIAMHDETDSVPWSELLKEDGTLVVWDKLDRLSGGITHDTARRSAHINAAMSNAERHLALVFHRFMEGTKPLVISINGRRLTPVDPFASKHPKTQKDPEDTLSLPGGNVVIRSFTLPHHKEMSKPEWDELGGPDGHLKSQGFYVYRGNRLIINGGWLGLARQTELTKLCRIRVDIPNTMDADWKIDVKKASAQLPPPVKERLKRIVERFAQTSKRTYTKKGQKLTDENRMPLWNRVLKDGTIVYRPNADHPAIADFSNSLPDDLKDGFRNCVALIGSCLPVDALHADMLGQAETVKADDADLDTMSQALHAMIPVFLERGFGTDAIKAILKGTELFRANWAEAEKIVDELLSEEEQ